VVSNYSGPGAKLWARGPLVLLRDVLARESLPGDE
jgi:hypothetical protein